MRTHSCKRALINIITKWLSKESEKPEFPLCDFDKIKQEVKIADVILVEGTSRISEIIQNLSRSPWSHAALYIGRIHDIEDPTVRTVIAEHWTGDEHTPLIIESELGKGTIISPLSTYEGQHLRICRPTGIAFDDAQKIIAYCSTALGKQYNIRHILDLARYLLPWKILPRKWFSYLYSKNSSYEKEICSSLIAKAFMSVRYPVLPYVEVTKSNKIELIPLNPKMFTPKDFDYSPYFEIIKYPMINVSGHSVYRDLPWNKNDVVVNNDGDKIEGFNSETSD